MNMENTLSEDFEDALSFCDLSFEDKEIEINNNNIENDQNLLISSQEFFEFSTSSSSSSSSSSSETNSNIIFCGKIISTKSDLDDQTNPVLVPKNKPRTRSLRCQSIGGNSRKHKVMIGLAKIPSKMELSDLRERQNRRTPPPMFPASPVVGGEASGPVNGNRSSNGKSHWGLLRSFRYRAHDLGTMLPKACFGSIWLARPCLD